MTVQSYMEQLEKIRGIANQDISMFENTPVRDVFKRRKMAAIKLLEADFHQREPIIELIDYLESLIKKYLFL